MKDNSETIALKMQLIDTGEQLELARYSLNVIDKIVKQAIKTNLNKTNRTVTPMVVKAYREELLTLREIENELKSYQERIGE